MNVLHNFLIFFFLIILLTQRFNIIKHFQMTFKNVWKMFFFLGTHVIVSNSD